MIVSDYYFFVFIGVQKLKILKTTRRPICIYLQKWWENHVGALETTTITTHIETSSFRQHPKNVGPLYYVEFLVKNFTPSMWRKPQRPCDLFSICGVLTLRLLPQATLTPLLHAAPLCVAAASCSPSLDSTGPLGPHDRPSATVDWIIRCLEDIFLDWRPVNQCTNSPQNASKRAFLHYKNPDIVYNF